MVFQTKLFTDGLIGIDEFDRTFGDDDAKESTPEEAIVVEKEKEKCAGKNQKTVQLNFSIDNVVKFLKSEGIDNVGWVEDEAIDGGMPAFQWLEFSHLFDCFNVGHFGLCHKILWYKDQPQNSLIPSADDLCKISLNYWGAPPLCSVAEATPPNVNDIIQTIAETSQHRLDALEEKKAKRARKKASTIEVKDIWASKRGKALISVGGTPQWQARSSVAKQYLPILDAYDKKELEELFLDAEHEKTDKSSKSKKHNKAVVA